VLATSTQPESVPAAVGRMFVRCPGAEQPKFRVRAPPAAAVASRIVRRIRRLVSIVCCIVVATAACDNRRTASTPAPTADSLILSVDDVRRIAGVDDLTAIPQFDSRRPYHIDHPVGNIPGSCRAAFDQEAVFGGDWTRFRSVQYDGRTTPAPDDPPANIALPPEVNLSNTVVQTVAVYPDTNAAHAAWTRLVPALVSCAGLHAKNYAFTVNKPDPSTVVLDYANRSTSEMYRVTSAVLIRVASFGFPLDEQIASTVLQTITGRIG
jgi:hypothetical protein